LWIATINPYKYSKSYVPHELIAFKTRCPNQQKAVLASSVLEGLSLCKRYVCKCLSKKRRWIFNI
jgi:hypothetical protein